MTRSKQESTATIKWVNFADEARQRLRGVLALERACANPILTGGSPYRAQPRLVWLCRVGQFTYQLKRRTRVVLTRVGLIGRAKTDVVDEWHWQPPFRTVRLQFEPRLVSGSGRHPVLAGGSRAPQLPPPRAVADSVVGDDRQQRVD